MVWIKHNYFSLVLLLILSLHFSFVPTNFLDAQISISAMETTASLLVEPRFPAPNSRVTVSLDAYAVDTLGGSTRWYVDGKEIVTQQNQQSVSFVTGAIGTKHAVRAVVSFTNRPGFEAKLTIPINQVDLIIESQTYTPSFYRGRALPGENAVIRAIAVTHTKPPGNPALYTYEWKLDGDVLFGGPILGKQVMYFNMPEFLDHSLSVTVYGVDGVALGREYIALNPVEPEVHFYEENLLRGLSRKALTREFTLIGEETTIYAEPYFMNTDITNTKGTFEWRLDGALVQSESERRNAITLRHTEGEGSANIGFRYVLDSIPIQYIQGAFDIFFK